MLIVFDAKRNTLEMRKYPARMSREKCLARSRSNHGEPAEKAYSEDEVRRRLAAELPHWYYEDGWIRRKFKTGGWKGDAHGGEYGRAISRKRHGTIPT